MTHTPEPWYALGIDVKADGDILNDTGLMVAECAYERETSSGESNAARIVACVNGCANLNPDAYRALAEQA